MDTFNEFVITVGSVNQSSRKTTRNVIYISSEKFTQDFIRSVRENKTTDFSNIYRNTDLLLVDDVQFFAGKEERFGHDFATVERCLH